VAFAMTLVFESEPAFSKKQEALLARPLDAGRGPITASHTTAQSLSAGSCQLNSGTYSALLL
jgi:hypothetical protein